MSHRTQKEFAIRKSIERTIGNKIGKSLPEVKKVVGVSSRRHPRGSNDNSDTDLVVVVNRSHAISQVNKLIVSLGFVHAFSVGAKQGHTGLHVLTITEEAWNRAENTTGFLHELRQKGDTVFTR